MTTDKRNRPRGESGATSTRNDNRNATPCPDCGAEVSPLGIFKHEPTCPPSAEAARAVADDAAWFRAHPEATQRRRPVTPGEATEYEMSYGWRPSGDLVVYQIRPGVRTRHVMEHGVPR